MGAPQALGAFAANCVVGGLNAAVARRVLGGLAWFGSLRKASSYIVITGVAMPAIAALGGAFVPILGGGDIWRYPVFWAQWYLSNALGWLTLGPIILIWLGRKPQPLHFVPIRRLIECAVLGVWLVAVCTLAFEVCAATAAIAV